MTGRAFATPLSVRGPVVKGGQVQLRNLYLLDALALTAPADTQFFCSNASGSLTVTLIMRALPPGRYAVVLADAAGAPLAGQIGLVLAWDPTGATRHGSWPAFQRGRELRRPRWRLVLERVRANLAQDRT